MVGQETFQTWCVYLGDLDESQLVGGVKSYLDSDDDYALDAKKLRRLAMSCEQDFMTADQAYIVASREVGKRANIRRWPNDKFVTYETACRVGFFELARNARSEMIKVWRETYDIVCREVAAGKEFKQPSEVLVEKKPSVRTSRAEGIRRAKQLMDLIDS